MSVDIICVKKRPNFGPRQIRTLKGLHIGQKVIQFSKNHGNWALLEIIGITFEDKYGFYQTVFEIDSNGCHSGEKRIYLDQHSIIPNKSKEWSDSWCLLRTRRKAAKNFFEFHKVNTRIINKR